MRPLFRDMSCRCRIASLSAPLRALPALRPSAPALLALVNGGGIPLSPPAAMPASQSSHGAALRPGAARQLAAVALLLALTVWCFCRGYYFVPGQKLVFLEVVRGAKGGGGVECG